MFYALHKVDMRMRYTKQKINLACPKPYQILKKVTVVIKNAFRHKDFIFV